MVFIQFLEKSLLIVFVRDVPYHESSSCFWAWKDSWDINLKGFIFIMLVWALKNIIKAVITRTGTRAINWSDLVRANTFWVQWTYLRYRSCMHHSKRRGEVKWASLNFRGPLRILRAAYHYRCLNLLRSHFLISWFLLSGMKGRRGWCEMSSWCKLFWLHWKRWLFKLHLYTSGCKQLLQPL